MLVIIFEMNSRTRKVAVIASKGTPSFCNGLRNAIYFDAIKLVRSIRISVVWPYFI